MPLLSYAKPDEIGLDGSRLQIAYQRLDEWTRGPQAPWPAAALLVGRRGKIVEPRFFGRQGPEPDAPPVRRDGLFLLASITKPIVYSAALMLVERGLLNLGDRVVRYLPAFAANNKEATLVSQLFTHTSGLPDMLPNNLELRKRHAPLADYVRGALDVTPLFAPGSDLRYQSMGTLVVAELVQQLSGQTIHDFLRREIFEPLGLSAIGLGSHGLAPERLIRVETDPSHGSDWNWNSTYWRELGSPWGGMLASPEDYAVLCQLFLNRGEYAGVRLLSPSTVRAMTTNRLHDYPQLPESVRRTKPWGLGWSLNHVGQTECWSDLLPQHVFGHLGATGTTVWMDPESGTFCLLFTTGIREKGAWRHTHVSNIVAASIQ